MASTSSYWKHQLGGSTTTLQSKLFIVAFILIVFFALSTTKTEARTESLHDPWDRLTMPFMAYERPSQGDTLMVSPLPPPYRSSSNSPVGLRNIRTPIHIPNQPAVAKYVRFYKGRGRLTFMTALERSWPHVQVMADILQSYGVPPELVYVVLVESCFKGKARSPGGAGGYWQFLAPTARSLGLRVDRWVDERWDPIKSTQAAARYLRSFYDKYHSWPLALAAYNAGEGPVISAIKRCHTKDFWQIANRGYLPGITRAYVPKIFAAIRIVRHLEMNDFESPRYLPIIDFESVWVKASLPLRKVAKWSAVPVTTLRSLNPSLRSDQLPPGRGYALRLPPGAKKRFNLAYEDYLRK